MFDHKGAVFYKVYHGQVQKVLGLFFKKNVFYLFTPEKKIQFFLAHDLLMLWCSVFFGTEIKEAFADGLCGFTAKHYDFSHMMYNK